MAGGPLGELPDLVEAALDGLDADCARCAAHARRLLRIPDRADGASRDLLRGDGRNALQQLLGGEFAAQSAIVEDADRLLGWCVYLPEHFILTCHFCGGVRMDRMCLATPGWQPLRP